MSGWTTQEKQHFLETLARTGNVTAAAQAVSRSRASAYRLRQRNAQFRDAWQAALDQAIDQLEGALLERAIQGVAKTVYFGGKACGETHSFSDALGMFLLKSRRPDIYGQLGQAPSLAGAFPNDEAVGELGPSPLEDLLEKLDKMSQRNQADVTDPSLSDPDGPTKNQTD